MARKRKPRDIGYDNMTDVQKAFYDGYDEGYLAGSSPAAGGQEQAALREASLKRDAHGFITPEQKDAPCPRTSA